jgi:metal-sulfur cluster biosynthetic enzyme
VLSKEGQVLAALARIIDPDFGMNIVDCGFIKDLTIDPAAGAVSFRMELTTPACPIKDDFEKAAREYVAALPWVTSLQLKMDARPPAPLLPDDNRPSGLRSVAHVIAVSSCKGGGCCAVLRAPGVPHVLRRLACLQTPHTAVTNACSRLNPSI